MIRRADNTGSWMIHDNQRSPYNVSTAGLYADQSATENTFASIDFTANGFKLRNASGDINASGGTMIYLAFAEYPFGGDGISQARAR